VQFDFCLNSGKNEQISDILNHFRLISY